MALENLRAGRGAPYLGTADHAYICTPSDTEDLPFAGRAFQVRGDAGDVKVITAAGITVTIPDVQQFERIDVAIKRVFDADTDATEILIYV